MKTDDELRRERHIGMMFSLVLISITVASWAVLKLVTGFSVVPTKSMVPTIHPGDRVAVNRLAYRFGTKPRAGDVAKYRDLTGSSMIHRIVGVPGDTLQMRDNVLFRNGTRVDEPYILLTPDIPAVRSFGPVEVPAGQYFFLGDNRDNANDSRFQGFIPEDQIRGRMGYVLHIGECGTP